MAVAKDSLTFVIDLDDTIAQAQIRALTDQKVNFEIIFDEKIGKKVLTIKEDVKESISKGVKEGVEQGFRIPFRLPEVEAPKVQFPEMPKVNFDPIIANPLGESFDKGAKKGTVAVKSEALKAAKSIADQIKAIGNSSATSLIKPLEVLGKGFAAAAVVKGIYDISQGIVNAGLEAEKFRNSLQDAFSVNHDLDYLEKKVYDVSNATGVAKEKVAEWLGEMERAGIEGGNVEKLSSLFTDLSKQVGGSSVKMKEVSSALKDISKNGGAINSSQIKTLTDSFGSEFGNALSGIIRDGKIGFTELTGIINDFSSKSTDSISNFSKAQNRLANESSEYWGRIGRSILDGLAPLIEFTASTLESANATARDNDAKKEAQELLKTQASYITGVTLALDKQIEAQKALDDAEKAGYTTYYKIAPRDEAAAAARETIVAFVENLPTFKDKFIDLLGEINNSEVKASFEKDVEDLFKVFSDSSKTRVDFSNLERGMESLAVKYTPLIQAAKDYKAVEADIRSDIQKTADEYGKLLAQRDAIFTLPETLASNWDGTVERARELKTALADMILETEKALASSDLKPEKQDELIQKLSLLTSQYQKLDSVFKTADLSALKEQVDNVFAQIQDPKIMFSVDTKARDKLIRELGDVMKEVRVQIGFEPDPTKKKELEDYLKSLEEQVASLGTIKIELSEFEQLTQKMAELRTQITDLTEAGADQGIIDALNAQLGRTINQYLNLIDQKLGFFVDGVVDIVANSLDIASAKSGYDIAQGVLGIANSLVDSIGGVFGDIPFAGTIISGISGIFSAIDSFMNKKIEERMKQIKEADDKFLAQYKETKAKEIKAYQDNIDKLTEQFNRSRSIYDRMFAEGAISSEQYNRQVGGLTDSLGGQIKDEKEKMEVARIQQEIMPAYLERKQELEREKMEIEKWGVNPWEESSYADVKDRLARIQGAISGIQGAKTLAQIEQYPKYASNYAYHGFSGTTDRKTNFTVSEFGQKEHVEITPHYQLGPDGKPKRLQNIPFSNSNPSLSSGSGSGVNVGNLIVNIYAKDLDWKNIPPHAAREIVGAIKKEATKGMLGGK